MAAKTSYLAELMADTDEAEASSLVVARRVAASNDRAGAVKDEAAVTPKANSKVTSEVNQKEPSPVDLSWFHRPQAQSQEWPKQPEVAWQPQTQPTVGAAIESSPPQSAALVEQSPQRKLVQSSGPERLLTATTQPTPPVEPRPAPRSPRLPSSSPETGWSDNGANSPGTSQSTEVSNESRPDNVSELGGDPKFKSGPKQPSAQPEAGCSDAKLPLGKPTPKQPPEAAQPLVTVANRVWRQLAPLVVATKSTAWPPPEQSPATTNRPRADSRQPAPPRPAHTPGQAAPSTPDPSPPPHRPNTAAAQPQSDPFGVRHAWRACRQLWPSPQSAETQRRTPTTIQPANQLLQRLLLASDTTPAKPRLTRANHPSTEQPPANITPAENPGPQPPIEPPTPMFVLPPLKTTPPGRSERPTSQALSAPLDRPSPSTTPSPDSLTTKPQHRGRPPVQRPGLPRLARLSQLWHLARPSAPDTAPSTDQGQGTADGSPLLIASVNLSHKPQSQPQEQDPPTADADQLDSATQPQVVNSRHWHDDQSTDRQLFLATTDDDDNHKAKGDWDNLTDTADTTDLTDTASFADTTDNTTDATTGVLPTITQHHAVSSTGSWRNR